MKRTKKEIAAQMVFINKSLAALVLREDAVLKELTHLHHVLADLKLEKEQAIE